VPLVIEKVLHKAVVEVNEKGTVASAATSVNVAKGKPPPPVMFTCNRPFIFGVQHVKTKTFMFLGKIVNPKQAAADLPK